MVAVVTWTEPGKWTCPNPRCPHRTVVIDGSPEDTAAAIEAVQRRHGTEHRKARELEAKLRRLPVTRTGKMTA